MSKITVERYREQGTISKYIYGQFTEHLGRCIYGGVWVGKDSNIPNQNGLRIDVVDALREIEVPVIRWPGGCFADEYHWRDGIGLNNQRKKMINTNWGGVVENNHFGTHEFFELCSQVGAEAYVNGNVGSGTVREMSEWVEYMTFSGISPMTDLRRKNGHPDSWKVKFFGVGNESWGCGGNMRPEYYADLYRQYQTFVRNYDVNCPIYKIATGPSVDDYHWMDVLMQRAGKYLNGISLHHYSLANSDWQHKGRATNFTENQWFSVIDSAKRMESLITKHSIIMDKYDPEHQVGMIVDEWGTWYDVEPGTNPGFLFQQNTIRDAMVAAITLHIFQNHTERVQMANIAQMINVLQSMILTDGDQIVKTPTYYVFKMFKDHQNAVSMDTLNNLASTTTASISRKKDVYLVSLCSYDLSANDSVLINFDTEIVSVIGEGLIGSKMDSHNGFNCNEQVYPRSFEQFVVHERSITVDLPPMSVVTLHVKIK